MSRVLLADWPSDTNPDKTYKIEQDDAGLISCTCLNWLTKRRFKGEDCKHITQYRKSQEEMKKQAEFVEGAAESA
jgi:hypothetical protein